MVENKCLEHLIVGLKLLKNCNFNNDEVLNFFKNSKRFNFLFFGLFFINIFLTYSFWHNANLNFIIMFLCKNYIYF